MIEVRARRPVASGLCAGFLALAGCSRPASHYAIDTVMASAYRPPALATMGSPPVSAAPDLVLAGDMHCHLSPPDHPLEASRDPAATVALAADEELDFLVLTPHVPARFFEHEELRAAVLAAQDRLRDELAARSAGRTVYVIGMEYTDPVYGHVGAAFADLRAVLADVPVDEARAHPGRFFERFVARGGFLVINHPLSTPLGSSLAMARADLSWRPFTSAAPVPEEIATVNRLAPGIEAYNMVVTHMRDRYLLLDTPRTLLATMARVDREIAAQQRRLVPVGGSDSHTDYLRPTTYVRAAGRSEAAVRDALAAGRVCVRSPEACSFEVRAPGGVWQGVGASLAAAPVIEARARGGDFEVLVGGEAVASADDSEIVRVPLSKPGCAVVRARVGDGFSAPIYVGCPFAG
ncbi:hypothetical protein WMF37_19060 [Sorangium sp. So ce291]|uniref:hypothetical protein n=1 Tax=Sorangium sp. So ce291 TaxID=3133294 RepID=UPI003F5F443A